MRNFKTFGWQAPKGSRYDIFNHIQIEGDLHYCASHNFVYNENEQEKLLYDGQPCYYTDDRFIDSSSNFYKKCYLFYRRPVKMGISLNACMRRVNKCFNIPKGTVVRFSKSWYMTNKNTSLDFIFKVKKENPLPLKFKINMPEYSDNFKTCDYSRELTDELRKNGFIVNVWGTNPDFLLGMIKTAVAYTGKDPSDIEDDDGDEIATAYGHGMKIGFSSKKNSYRGYSNGCENVLFDYFGEFDKWSRCHVIAKDYTPADVVKLLLNAAEDHKKEIETKK